MKSYLCNTDEADETAKSRRLGFSGWRWRAVVVPIVLGIAFLVVLFTRLLPVYSDDGPGVEEVTPNSPEIIWVYPGGDESFLHDTKSVAGDLLSNGDMDQQGFYWRYPNHYIAGSWFEWFSTRRWIPEYTYGDKDFFIHTRPGSQRIHAWANSYIAGLLQSSMVTPCTYYRFQAYGHSRPGSTDPPPVPVASHMKVGIEPYGWLPDGMVGKTIPNYDPGLEPEEFPPTVVWSPEATHNFVWTPYEITAEAQSSAATVILYSNPEVNPDRGVWWNDTLWDTASLVEIPWPRDTLLDSTRLPVPDGQITNLNANLYPYQATVQWDTAVGASTQLLYRVREPSTPISGTLLLYALYLPRVDMGARLSDFEHSPVDTTPVNHHQVVLSGLPDDYLIEFVALSRWLDDDGCVTSASAVDGAATGSVLVQDSTPPSGGE